MRTRLQIGWTPAEPTPLEERLDVALDRLSTLLDGARITALTGAGLSTDSGIPDYRSPGAPARTPMTVQMFLSSPEFRRHYWARNHLGWRHMDAATPNAGHHALAELGRQGRLTGVITQNVDMLHTKARTRRVIELHGCYGRVRCLDCDATLSRHRLAEMLEDLNPDFAARVSGRGAIEVAPDADVALDDTADFVVAPCPRCGGILKPDIVYFGENASKELVAQSFAMIDESDALLVAGSSLTVMSGLRFARYAHRTSKTLVVVNRGATRADHIADLKIDHFCGVVLPALAQWGRADRGRADRGRADRLTEPSDGHQVVGVDHRAPQLFR
ncbi:NAD-dependent deacetylase [Gordonia polyisoprenivorans]|uniref:Sir2 family NAD-dependent protein deacetylase n=1 Tax=Gordonia polyisoprenivorans TaxID=84595 RepID=UPI00037AB15F|nr:Sir2 family NAD-dependent protein deacetylase [Gordonia polyisoprenivorans]QUD80872.1 NAD-dependent deacetylase [Gordonia polyisoprenivorans]